MMTHARRAALAACIGLSVATPLAAQIDYRNLDDDRPTRVEDAYPAERFAFELLTPWALSRSRAGSVTHVFLPELAFGALRDLQVGLKLPIAGADAPGGRTWGVAGLRAFALYNLNTESPLLPALSMRLDGAFPNGSLGGDAPRGSVKLIATRSWGRTRLHLNGAVGFGREGVQPASEGLPRWWYGAAVDRTLFRQSLLIVAETYALRASAGTPTEVNASLGARWQWTPTTVLDLGVTRRLAPSGPDFGVTFGISKAFAIAALMPRRPAAPDTTVRRDRRSEQFYYPGSFNWQFLSRYPEAGRLFNAFDYGHAVLYERLYQEPDSARAAPALGREFRYLTQDLLMRPPRFAVAEEVIEPAYAKLAWQAKQMFDWAHMLHRQIYDVYADDRIEGAAKDSLIERLTDYYLSRGDIAFTTAPKSMALMDEQYFSQVFRRRYPAFNGLIWSYHWLQVGLYEPLIAGHTADERRAGVRATVARFWELIADPPTHMPRIMPMTATVAPQFTARHPRAAAIFDNLHMMHDIISDILAADTVPHAEKRRVIYEALREFRDSTRHVMNREEWLMMGDMMGGIDAMGGPVPGARPAPPAGGHRHQP